MLNESLFFSAVLFMIGVVGVLTRRNVLGVLMSIELMFNAIADHIPELTPVAAPERLRHSMINGIKHWQVAYR